MCLLELQNVLSCSILSSLVNTSSRVSLNLIEISFLANSESLLLFTSREESVGFSTSTASVSEWPSWQPSEYTYPNFAPCSSRSIAGTITVSILIPKQGNFLGGRVSSRADVIILVITTNNHLAGNPCGSSAHLKMVLIIPPSWVKTDSSLTLTLRGSLIIIALVATITLVVAALVVEMIGRPLLVVLAASLIPIVEVVGVVVVVVATASAATTTLVSILRGHRVLHGHHGRLVLESVQGDD